MSWHRSSLVAGAAAYRTHPKDEVDELGGLCGFEVAKENRAADYRGDREEHELQRDHDLGRRSLSLGGRFEQVR